MNVVRSRAGSVVRGVLGLVRDRTVVALSLLFGVAVASLLWHQSSQRSHHIESTAIQQAARYSDAVTEFRTVYTSEVVKTAMEHGLEVTHDYKHKDSAIPLPATLSMILGNRLAEKKSGGQTRLYSPHPFPWRKETGGLRDDFAREAWEALNKNPERPFHRFEEIDGRPSLRYATADLMRHSCVRCHNSHPDTPRRDWKEGDVRGVLEVAIPLNVAVAQANSDRDESYLLVLGLSALGLACIGMVVTRFRRTSSELEKQVVERTQEANRAMNAAETANRSKSEFLANMSHEIRTPMTAILGFNDILLDNMTSPVNIDAARTVKKNGEFLIELVNDILDLSKIEAGKFDVEQAACSPREIVADVSELMTVRAKAKDLPLEVRFEGPIPETIRSDPTRLRQILLNVVGNAIKFTETGSVQVVTRLLNGPGDEPKLRIDVIDTGIGISEDNINKVFQPFTQVDGSMTRQFGGTGLGLTISKRLLQILGGDISVSSTIEKGSTFSVTISTGPLHNVRLINCSAKTIANTEVAIAADEVEDPLRDCRILLAEDGPDNQRLISFILKKAGAEVTLAENGQIGFDLASAAQREGRPFDVILMDMQMPVLDGYAATARLRNDGYSGPILALTAHAMTSDRQKCLDAGCDEFLSKPVDRKTLVESVHEWSNRVALR